MSHYLVGARAVAEYTGLSVSTVKYHLYVSKTLLPFRLQHGVLLFTASAIDDWLSTRRRVGRLRNNRKSPLYIGDISRLFVKINRAVR